MAKLVSILIEDLGGGGAEKITVLLANALVQKGFAVDLIMQRAVGPYLGELDTRIRTIDLRATGHTPVPTVLFLRRYLRERRPDVLLTQMEKPSLLAIVAGLLAGYRNVVPCVHTNLIAYANFEHKIRRTLLKFLVGFFYRFARRICTVSKGAANTMYQLVGRFGPPIDIVYNGLDLDNLRRTSVLPTSLPWLDDKSVPVIVSCGRMVPQKGFDILLKAFADLRRLQYVRLIILGDGPIRRELEALMTQLGIDDDCMMPGFKENPHACFAKADLFVLSSRIEGLSNVLIEALAAGVPIVSTDCPTGPREVLEGGRFGRLVPVDDIMALSGAMQNGLQLAKRDTRDAEIANHLRTFSLDTMIEGYLRMIDLVHEKAAKTPY